MRVVKNEISVIEQQEKPLVGKLWVLSTKGMLAQRVSILCLKRSLVNPVLW
jgi:hypothetical protein